MALALAFGIVVFAFRFSRQLRKLALVAVLCLAVPLTISTLRSPAEPATVQSLATTQGLFRSINSRA